MDPFEQKVKDFIDRNLLLPPGSALIVALSGGADSVALLAVLDALGYNCSAAHCNFHLRGDESNRDMLHAGQVTEDLGIDLCIKDFDVAARRKATGESLEMACRELRYKWFDDLIDRLGAKAVAVGHHREDSVETFFINLLRGSGIGGLCGISPRQGHVIRPLLDCSRDEIEEYLHRRGLSWVDDSTNAGDDFLRNRLRNRLIPLLDEISDGASDAILRSMNFLKENRTFYNHAIERRGNAYRDADSGDIDLNAMSTDPDAPILLFEMLRAEGFSRRQTDDMLLAARRDGGLFVAGDIKRHLDHGILRAPHVNTSMTPGCYNVTVIRDISEPINIEVSRHDISEFKPEASPNVIYIDEKALEGEHQWQLRPWRRGDRLEPFGLNGSKLVSDIFAHNKLSAACKDSTWLLWRDETLMWVVGLRASRHFAITPQTRRFIRLEFKPDNSNR